MNLLNTIVNANDDAVVRQMATALGLSEDAVRNAVRHVVPVLSRGISQGARRPGGFDALLGAVQSGKHRQYVEQPDLLSQRGTIADGNAILGHVFGSKDVSRNVAGHAARQTGLSQTVLKQLLPMVAAAAMGSMGQQTSGGGVLSQLAGGKGSDPGIAGVLEGFLDSDRDGAVVDDLLSLAQKFF